ATATYSLSLHDALPIFLLQLGVFPLDAQIPFGQSHLGLPVGQPVHGVVAHLPAQRFQLRVDVGFTRRPTAPPPRRFRRQPGRGGLQRRGQVTPHLRLPVLHPPGQRHPAQRSRGPGIVGVGNPSCPTV